MDDSIERCGAKFGAKRIWTEEKELSVSAQD